MLPVNDIDPSQLLAQRADPLTVACWLGALQLPRPDTVVVLSDEIVELAIVCFTHASPAVEA